MWVMSELTALSTSYVRQSKLLTYIGNLFQARQKWPPITRRPQQIPLMKSPFAWLKYDVLTMQCQTFLPDTMARRFEPAIQYSLYQGAKLAFSTIKCFWLPAGKKGLVFLVLLEQVDCSSNTPIFQKEHHQYHSNSFCDFRMLCLLLCVDFQFSPIPHPSCAPCSHFSVLLGP